MNYLLNEKTLLEKSSQELTDILYKGCIDKLKKSIIAVKSKDYGEANRQLQKCNDIIYRLGAGLKYDAGQIADQLDNLYNYMAEKLIQANISKDVESIEIVLAIMQELSDSWQIAMTKRSDTGKINKKIIEYEQNISEEVHTRIGI